MGGGKRVRCDPATVQFLSRDPAAAVTGSPYGYVGGNPLNATDPTGRCSWNPFDSDSCEIAETGKALTSAWNKTTTFVKQNAQGFEFALSAVAAATCIVVTVGVCAGVTVGALVLRVGLRFASGSADAGPASLVDALLTATGLGLVNVPAILAEKALDELPFEEALGPLYRLIFNSRMALPDVFSLYADAMAQCPEAAP